MVDESKQKRQFEKDGFLIIRDFFTRAEVEDLLKVAGRWEDYLAEPKCISSYAGSESIFSNTRLHSLVKNLIGDEPIYFGDGNITPNVEQYKYTEGDGMLHKDCIDRNDYTKPDWQSRYTSIRLGIYTNDHSDCGGGIAFRRGTHKKPLIQDKFYRRKPLIYLTDFLEMIFGKTVYANVKPGDLVIWKLTTDHAGNASCFRFLKNRAITKFTNFIPKIFRKPQLTGLRVAMFVSFGANDNHLDRFISGQKKRIYQVESWLASKYENSAVNGHLGVFKLRDVGSELRDMEPDELKRSLTTNWQPG